MLRGREVSRLEGFTDAVIAFAVTLLVVSLEVPEDYADLQRTLVGFPAFAVTFTVICWIWYEHYLLFQRHDLSDGFTVVLNCALLFIVLFYAYPLKFVFTRLIGGILIGTGPDIGQGMTEENARILMLVYSAGFVALFGIFMLLYWNAWRQRGKLALGPLQVYDTRAGVWRHSINVAIGLLSIVLTIALPTDWLPLGGLVFFLLGPAHGAYGYLAGRRRERLEPALAPAAQRADD